MVMRQDLSINEHRLLTFDWDEVENEAVTAIVGEQAHRTSWSRIAILLCGKAVVISEVDACQLVVEHKPLPDPQDAPWIPVPCLADYIGRPLGWCWQGRNYRGYLDTFVLSFHGIEPQVAFHNGGTAITPIKMTEFSEILGNPERAGA